MSVQPVGPYRVGPAVGSDGSAEASFVTPIVHGVVLAVVRKYTFPEYSAGSLDLSVVTQGTLSGAPPSEVIEELTSDTTDGWLYPKSPIHDQAGAVIADQYAFGIPVADALLLSIANASTDDIVDVWLLIEN